MISVKDYINLKCFVFAVQVYENFEFFVICQK